MILYVTADIFHFLMEFSMTKTHLFLFCGKDSWQWTAVNNFFMVLNFRQRTIQQGMNIFSQIFIFTNIKTFFQEQILIYHMYTLHSIFRDKNYSYCNKITSHQYFTANFHYGKKKVKKDTHFLKHLNIFYVAQHHNHQLLLPFYKVNELFLSEDPAFF